MEKVNNYINHTEVEVDYENKKNLLKDDTKSNENLLNTKIGTLLSHKYSFEKILKLIKKLQSSLISKKSVLNDNKEKKEILLEFKKHLTNILEKKAQTFKRYKKEIDEKKEKINKKIPFNTEKENNINYIAEIDQLRFINFNIENEIKSVDFWIKEKSEVKDNKFEYLGILSEQKIYCDLLEKNDSESTEIMKDEKKVLKKQLVDLTIKKSEVEEEIHNIKKRISKLKKKIRKKNNSNFEESKECSNDNNYINKNQSEQNQSVRDKYKDLIQKWEDIFVNKNNLGSESSNKETNFSSVKNFVDNIDKLNEEKNINYDYLKNQIFFDIHNDKTSNSFNSSLDSGF